MQQKFRLLLSLIVFGLFTNLSYGQSCDGGTVSTAAGDTTTYTCPGDGNADMIMFAHTTSSMDNYAYVVTDPSGVILGLPPGNTVDFPPIAFSIGSTTSSGYRAFPISIFALLANPLCTGPGAAVRISTPCGFSS